MRTSMPRVFIGLPPATSVDQIEVLLPMPTGDEKLAIVS